MVCYDYCLLCLQLEETLVVFLVDYLVELFQVEVEKSYYLKVELLIDLLVEEGKNH